MKRLNLKKAGMTVSTIVLAASLSSAAIAAKNTSGYSIAVSQNGKVVGVYNKVSHQNLEMIKMMLKKYQLKQGTSGADF